MNSRSPSLNCLSLSLRGGAVAAHRSLHVPGVARVPAQGGQLAGAARGDCVQCWRHHHRCVRDYPRLGRDLTGNSRDACMGTPVNWRSFGHGTTASDRWTPYHRRNHRCRISVDETKIAPMVLRGTGVHGHCGVVPVPEGPPVTGVPHAGVRGSSRSPRPRTGVVRTTPVVVPPATGANPRPCRPRQLAPWAGTRATPGTEGCGEQAPQPAKSDRERQSMMGSYYS